MSLPPDREKKLEQLRIAPAALRAAVAGLTDAQLDTAYREGGWTVRQVVHHVADSHAHAYLRCKFIVAEEHPGIKTYDQDVWATLPDNSLPLDVSLRLVEALHERWVAFLGALPENAWQRGASHPERGEVTLESMLDVYSDHAHHHAAQITGLRERSGW